MSAASDRIVQISDLKRNPARILDEVRKGMPVTITQGSRADAILVLRDQWAELHTRVEALEEELELRELLADPKVRQRLERGLPKRGIPLSEVRARLVPRGRTRSRRSR